MVYRRQGILLRNGRIVVFAFIFVIATACVNTGAWKNQVAIPKDIGLSNKVVPFTDFVEYDASVLGHWSDGDRTYVVDFLKFKKNEKKPIGRFFNLSRDGGRSFEGERAFGDVFGEHDDQSRVSLKITKGAVSVTILADGNLDFVLSENGLNQFSKPARINDFPNSVGLLPDTILLNPLHTLVVWQDMRDGGSRLYYSVSEDGGKTWGLNQRISDSPVTQGQERVHLAQCENGRIFAVWMDWRSKKTLVDIRGAYSDNGGKAWSEDFQINDDGLSVWQMDPSITADGPFIIVAFSDFRDRGPNGDNDWNIYFARSVDNGESWEPNRRLNTDIRGRQETPKCSMSIEGAFYCVYFSGAETIFGRTAFVVSSDRGESWSDSAVLGPVVKRSPLKLSHVAVFSGSRFCVLEWRAHKSDDLGKVTLAEPGYAKAPGEEPAAAEADPVQRKTGPPVFSDDFSGKTADRWKAVQGAWSLEDDTFMGSVGIRGESGSKSYKALATFREPLEYELSGRFRLDPVSHIAAVIYFRDSGNRHFAVTNQFRHGAWIGFDGGEFGPGRNVMNASPWTQTVLAEKNYSFKNDIWYDFRLVVTKNQADYYVNDKLFLTARLESENSAGNFGLGGFSTSPSYFDDIEVRLLDQ